MTAALADIRLGDPWHTTVEDRSRSRVRLRVEDTRGAGAQVVLERCTAGRLRDAYPVGEHDIEVRPAGIADLTALLRDVVVAVEAADPRCRRIVFAAVAGDLAGIAAAESAGFRYVVDVDLPATSLSLLVAEPGWVTRIDQDSDAITARPGNRLG